METIQMERLPITLERVHGKHLEHLGRESVSRTNWLLTWQTVCRSHLKQSGQFGWVIPGGGFLMGSTGDARNCNALQRLAKLHAKESHRNILSAVRSCWPVKKASRFGQNCCLHNIHGWLLAVIIMHELVVHFSWFWASVSFIGFLRAS